MLWLALLPSAVWLAGSPLPARPTPFVCPPAMRVPGKPIELGEQWVAPKKIKHVSPVYPAASRDAKKEGVVTIEGVIAIDGKMRDLKVTKSVDTDLDNAALEAVKQWEYTPTMFGGRPCEVVIHADVKFAPPSDAAPGETDAAGAPAPPPKP